MQYYRKKAGINERFYWVAKIAIDYYCLTSKGNFFKNYSKEFNSNFVQELCYLKLYLDLSDRVRQNDQALLIWLVCCSKTACHKSKKRQTKRLKHIFMVKNTLLDFFKRHLLNYIQQFILRTNRCLWHL